MKGYGYPSVPTVYLDQNHWIGLLKASRESGTSSADKRLLELLRSGTRQGLYTCILSASHYHETWNRARKDSRHALAGLMRELTSFASVAPYQTVRLHEDMSILAQLNKSAGHLTAQACASREVVFGQGVDHAFSSPTGRFRFVSHLATEGQVEGPPVDPPCEFVKVLSDVKDAAPEQYEWISLAGFDEHPEVKGFELHTQRRRGQEFADFRTYFSNQISERRTHDAENVRRFLLAEFAQNVSAELTEAADASNLATPAMESWHQIERLIEAMPSCNVLYRLVQCRQRNRQKKWESNDLADLSSLAVAVPYADLTVTERQWAAIARAERLGRRYHTNVIHSRSDLLVALENGWPQSSLPFP